MQSVNLFFKARKDHDQHLGLYLPDFGDHVEAFPVGNVNVENDQVELVAAELGKCLTERTSFMNGHRVEQIQDQEPGSEPDNRVVFDQ